MSSSGLPEPLKEFIDELVRLRAAAGNPSFRRMAAKSGAVSHATLHQTVAGYRLQPWETVREFVRACDGDEDAMLEHWERTRRALAELSSSAPDDAPVGRWWRRRTRLTLVTVAAVVVVAAVATTVAFAVGDDPPVESADHTPSPTPTTVGPVFPGDAVQLTSDVTYPDDTVVKPGKTLTKVWEFQNVGTVSWHGRYLDRVDPQTADSCRTPDRAGISDTAPQQQVKVSIRFTTPKKAPITCKVHFKMVDRDGRQLFPANKPVFFKVRVRD